ncbi:hypothetical protein F4054_12685 [Candidatus Poribacteria bacterium]|nr:hypothetical protein [Candidatus Poribacteria bacterium]MYG07683.1 hypothetical protein [Candidatus Poribacteria bacterium]MYK23098.1 hypothetical protein [Candidatus Poribacteria bacterium]
MPPGQFISNDAYLFAAQSEEITKHGKLPARDMQRWLPNGRDNGQLLSLYAYVIAYTHKVIGWLFPKLTVYHIQLYAPALCFMIGLGAVFLFLERYYGVMFACIVGVLLATLPGSISRSIAGFSDRDAWCWMLGTLAVISYLWKERLPLGRQRWLTTALAGFIVFLGGLSWEAFGVFVLIIVAIELWKFVTIDTEEHFKEYLFWLVMFVPWLYLISPVYPSGYGFSTHVTALLLFPPLTVCAVRGIRHGLLKGIVSLRQHAQKLTWGLTLIALMLGIGYFFFQAETFETTAFAFQESLLMKNISELEDPNFGFWTNWYGGVFALGSLGWIVASFQFGWWKGLPMALSLSLFTVTTFFRDPMNIWVGEATCNTLFIVSLGLTVLSFAVASVLSTVK